MIKILRGVAIVIVITLAGVIITALTIKIIRADCNNRIELLADTNLLTGLTSFILGFVAYVVTGIIEGERTRRERKERIDAAEKSIRSDFVYALKQIADLEKETHRWWNKWEPEQCEQIKRLREICESREGFRIFLQEAGKVLEGKSLECDEKLNIAKSFYKDKQRTQLMAICAVRSEEDQSGKSHTDKTSFSIFRGPKKRHKSIKSNGNGSDNNIETLLSIWDEYDVYSADLVVNLLNTLPRKPSRKTKTIVKDALEKTSSRKRLIRYKQLGWMEEAYGLTLPDEYYFVKPFHHFFETDVIQPNVLYSELFHVEKIVEEGWVNPTQWGYLKSVRESARAIVFEKDARVFMQALWKEYVERQKMPRDGIFSVFWDVKPSELSFSVLEPISHQVAETWIEFSIVNPNAFLDLRPAERDALAGFLGWHMGSLQALNDRLRQRFTQIGKDSSGKENDVWAKERDILLERMANSSLPYGKDILPNNEQLLDWLNIRPPWLTHTVLIPVYEKMPNDEWQQAVSAFQRDLLKQKVVVKEIVITQELPEEFDVLVRWSDDNLLEILKLRVQKTCGRDSFTALFARPPWVSDTLEYDYRLVRQSHGSLGRMLELGQKILSHHAQYHPDSEELQPDDFEAIEQS